MMPSSQPATTATKKDNLFGICAALGEEFHFNPLYLRLALAISLLWNPTIVFAVYFYTGFVLLAARWVFPRRRRSAATPAAAVPSPAGALSNDEGGHVELARAA